VNIINDRDILGMSEQKTVIVTGAAGFIGYHVSKRLLDYGFSVVGVDNINDYYDISLKHDRLNMLREQGGNSGEFVFERGGVDDKSFMSEVFSKHKPTYVIHLAAQAGVRYSIENPQAYIDSNVTGFLNVLEASKENKVLHLLYASSSSVYGNSADSPFDTKSVVAHPVSMYAATKRMNELMAQVFATQYDLPCTGLRFFTVYGPWGRPDMAPIKFADAIMSGETLHVYNHGEHYRDFTYVDDIVDGILLLLSEAPKKGKHTDSAPDRSQYPHRIYNIGAQTPVYLMDFIGLLEKELGVKANKKYLPMQMGDVVTTVADVSDLIADTGYRPSTTVEVGVKKFADWYKMYNKK
jgi:UDP-glucuronate 4-epimerase